MSRTKTVGFSTAILFMIFIIVTQFMPIIVWAITWSSDIPLITNDPYWDSNPSFTQTADGKMWVVYTSDKEDFAGDLYYVTYDGSSWSTQQRLTDHPAKDDNPSIIQTENGVIWVVWSSERDIDPNIYYKTSSDNGASWSIGIVTTDPDRDEVPSITQAADGKVWVVWSSLRTGNYEIFYKTYDGSSWSPHTQLTDNLSNDYNPSVFTAWDGKIWVVWSSLRIGNWEIFYKTYDGSSWSPHTQLTDYSKADSNPSITQARDGTIWIVWVTEISGKIHIYYKTSTNYGLSWSPKTPLVTSSDDDVAPSIANTMEGELWMTWARYTAGFDIYYKNSDPIPIHDVAVAGVTANATLVYQKEIVEINVIAENQGTEQETFDVICYVNSTEIGNEPVTLTAGSSTTITFNWNTTDAKRGNYVLSATASIVTDETLPNQEDNTFTNGIVRVKLLGDVNDDGIVNVIDLATIGRSYGTSVGDPLYDREADITRDGIIDIADLATAAWNYLKTG